MPGVRRLKNELALALGHLPSQRARPDIGASEEHRQTLPNGERDRTRLQLCAVWKFVDENPVRLLPGHGRLRDPDKPERARRSVPKRQHGWADDHLLGFLKLVLAASLGPAKDARLHGDAVLVIGLKGEERTGRSRREIDRERHNLQRLRRSGTDRQRRQKRKRRKGFHPAHRALLSN